MKAREINDELLDRAYRLPKNIIEEIEKSADKNRRSINNEMIVILDLYFNKTICLPDDLRDRLDRVSEVLLIPIKDIISRILEENLAHWAGDEYIKMIREMSKTTDSLEKYIENGKDIDFINSIYPQVKQMREFEEREIKIAEVVKRGLLPMKALFNNGNMSNEEIEDMLEKMKSIYINKSTGELYIDNKTEPPTNTKPKSKK